MHDKPNTAKNKRRGYSMWEALQQTVTDQTDATISTGNSGVYGWFSRIASKTIHKSLEEPAIVQDVPLPNGDHNVLTDVGYYLARTPERYLQLALIGTAYAKANFGIKHPRVGLLNIGEEESKGDESLRSAHQYLSHIASLNKYPLDFAGNVEGNDVLKNDKVDVVIADAYTGNAILKFAEQYGKNMKSELSEGFHKNLLTKLAGMIMKNPLKQQMKKYAKENHGGAPLVGLNHLCLICHGNSKQAEIIGAIAKAQQLIRSHLISEVLSEFTPFIPLLEGKINLADEEKKGDVLPFQPTNQK
jgi:glycerol-3-phosphate acyltransferase PlsX